MHPKIDSPLESLILRLHQEEHMTHKQITDHVKCARGSVGKILKRAKNPNPLPSNKGGRPKSTTKRYVWKNVPTTFLKAWPSHCPQIYRKTVYYAPEIRKELNLKISSRTVQRRLVEVGLNAWRPAKVPKLNKKHVKNRLEFAKQYVQWSVEYWKKKSWIFL